MLLPHVWSPGLEHIDAVTVPDNVASRRVIAACGSLLVQRFHTDLAYGGVETLRHCTLRPGGLRKG